MCSPKIVFLLGSLFLIGSVTTAFPQDDPSSDETFRNHYQLSVRDQVEISVYDEPDLQAAHRIDSRGQVRVPLAPVGQVFVEGALWRARPIDEGTSLDRGYRVRVESVDGLTLLVKPQGGALWPFAVGAVLAISSKYVLRYRDHHLWNPTNFAVSALLLAAPDRVSVLSHQFGNDVATNLVIWVFGLIIVARVGVLHITLTYVTSFLLLNGVRATMLGQPVLPEIAPITGPMYQLFIFFMITDPRTVVRDRRPQIVVAVLIAVMETLIRFASDQAWPLPTEFSAAPAFLALASVGPVAKWRDLRRMSRQTVAPSLKAASAPAVPSLAADR
jgi:enediyne biosynthesis protein E5